ncbi:MAG: HAD family hydrolase [Pseudomonadota bacterium]
MSEAEACAVIFDVDGVLLHLTEPEENAFFTALELVFGITGASSDWDSYKVRNDVAIVEELIETHLGREANASDLNRFTDKYISLIDIALKTGEIKVQIIAGIRDVLMSLTQIDEITMGLATANMMPAAKLRLRAAGLNDFFTVGGFAEARGPKREILRKTIAELRMPDGASMPRDRIVYLGDNLVDVDAGLSNGCGFIAFNVDKAKHGILREAGAEIVLSDHADTAAEIRKLLGMG